MCPACSSCEPRGPSGVSAADGRLYRQSRIMGRHQNGTALSAKYWLTPIRHRYRVPAPAGWSRCWGKHPSSHHDGVSPAGTRCAAALANTPARPRELKPTMPDVPEILLRNVYGWFIRVVRGLYAVSDAGRTALAQWHAAIPTHSTASLRRTPMPSPVEHTRRLLFFPRHLQVTNFRCTRPIAQSTLFSEGTRVPHARRGGMHAYRRFFSRHSQLRPFCGPQSLERRLQQRHYAIRQSDQPGHLDFLFPSKRRAPHLWCGTTTYSLLTRGQQCLPCSNPLNAVC